MNMPTHRDTILKRHVKFNVLSVVYLKRQENRERITKMLDMSEIIKGEINIPVKPSVIANNGIHSERNQI